MPTVVDLLNQILAAIKAGPDATGLGKIQATLDANTKLLEDIGAGLGVTPPVLTPEDQAAVDAISKESGDLASQSGEIAKQSQPPT